MRARKIVAFVGRHDAFQLYARERADQFVAEHADAKVVGPNSGRFVLTASGIEERLMHVTSTQQLRGLAGPIELVMGYGAESVRNAWEIEQCVARNNRQVTG